MFVFFRSTVYYITLHYITLVIVSMERFVFLLNLPALHRVLHMVSLNFIPKIHQNRGRDTFYESIKTFRKNQILYSQRDFLLAVLIVSMISNTTSPPLFLDREMEHLLPIRCSILPKRI